MNRNPIQTDIFFISPNPPFFIHWLLPTYREGRLTGIERSQENEMPHYDYECKDCGTVVGVKATIAEKERGLDVTCSKCGSKSMEQVFNTMAVVSGGFSMPSISSMPTSKSSGGGCGCGAGGCGSH